MKKLFRYILILLLGLFMFQACQEDVDPGVSIAYPVAGEWVVSEYWDVDGEWVNGYGPYVIPIYNTSFDADSIYIDNIYDSGIQIKAKVNQDKTFTADSSLDLTGTVHAIVIDEGKIIGDSIMFSVKIWEEVDSLVYEITDEYIEAGVRKTGFE